MNSLPPIALIVFSNDLDNFLPNIEKERNLIEEALQHYDDSNRLKVIARTGVTIEGLFKLFNRYKGRIALFHFAGHADGKGLQLEENANAQGLADLFRREATEGQLRFVFLNGCSTKAQISALRAASVPSVIATNCPINDNKALEFSQQFYRSLSNADQTAPFDYPTTLEKAFDNAKSFLKTKYKDIEVNKKGLLLKRQQITFEWELDSDFLEWTLPKEIIYPSIDFQAGAKWVESLRQTLTKQRIKVGHQPLAVFACYGSLVEVYLQKMETKVSKEKPLMRLGFMADAFQSSLRYLCYIQLAQLLKLENAPKKLELQDFFEMKTEDQKRFDYLNLLEITTDLLPKEIAFIPEQQK